MSHPSTWTVVVPSFNHADDSIACLESLWRANPRPGNVLLVDDASTEDAVATITRWAAGAGMAHQIVAERELNQPMRRNAWLTIVTAQENGGFVRTCNIGLRYVRDFTDAPYVFLLNNDAVVTPSYFAELAKALARVPDTGLLTGSIYEWDRSTVWYGGAYYNPLRAIGGHTTKLPESDAPTPTGYVCGCSMLISRPVLLNVGLLADCFRPIYVEDVDYSLRARAAGYPLMIARAAVCYHRVGTTLGRTRQAPHTVFAFNRNRAFALRRNYDGWRRAVGIAYLAVTKPGRAVLEFLRGRPRTAWAVLSGTLVGVFSTA
ncbi:MAG TPA: glycosyltransferase family 2 protein, partial [Gemmatimonadaceae bacterium]|nr:glycosyltransferase family 2 protein [Gemmatimonadaceae bacterium]